MIRPQHLNYYTIFNGTAAIIPEDLFIFYSFILNKKGDSFIKVERWRLQILKWLDS